MVATGGRNLKCALCPFLPLHVAEVAAAVGGGAFARLGRGNRRLASEVLNQFRQGIGRDHLGPVDPGRFGAAGGGTEKRAVLFGGCDGGGQAPEDRDQGPVERQLAQGDGAFHRVLGQDLDRGQQGQRNRQVEMAALFRQVCGRKVDCDPFRGQRDMHRGQGGAHTVARLADRLVGQADDGEGRQPGGHGALHLDLSGFDPFEGNGVGFGDHGISPVKQG